MQLNDEQLGYLGESFHLSPRERDVLALLFEGVPDNRAMAARLGTTPGAIQAAMRMLYAKTRSASRHEVVLFCSDVLTAWELRRREGRSEALVRQLEQAIRRRIGHLDAVLSSGQGPPEHFPK